jgi:hypothetical protein
MTELKIDRLSASAAANWPAQEEVAGMLRRVADDRLERALAEHALPEGDWCVRRLDVDLDLDPERPLSALETDWADRIVTALRQSLRDGSRDVVRYVRPEQAVDDLLRGTATGRFERDWAWHQVGLLQPGDPDPRSNPRGVFLTVLARLPQGPSAALDRLVLRVGLAVVHRLLGRDGWMRVAALAVPGADVDVLLGEPTVSASQKHPKRRAAAAVNRASLARALTGTGTIPAAVRSAALHADQPTTHAWALLTIAAADPSLLHRPADEVRELVHEVATLLVPGPGRTLRDRAPAEIDAAPGATVDASPASFAQGARVDLTDRPDVAGAPAAVGPDPTVANPRTERVQAAVDGFDPVDDSEPAPAHTSWGGLAFLLNTAADAGLPDVLDQPPFLARPASWVLRRLGRELVGVEADDPALLALAGQDAVAPQAAATEPEQAAIEACAARWASVTALRLRTDRRENPRTDTELVRALARRAATILWEPGWVEVSLRLDDVDLDVRRAGLDLDPGWVWWLGQVVRFRYE